MTKFKTLTIFELYIIIICLICVKETVNTIDCTSDYIWHCDTGNECIDSADLCDGTPNCADGSDETIKNCINNKCPKISFRCTYGACVPYKNTCDQNKDCIDGSDELKALCQEDEYKRELQGTCQKFEMECRSGECITQDNICDGRADCQDASDESLNVCSSYPCQSHSFRCGYGACINGNAKCNGINDCLDESDESPVMCGTTDNSKTSTKPKQQPQTSRPPVQTTPPRVPITLSPAKPPKTCRIPTSNNNLIVKNQFNDEKINLGDAVPVNTLLQFTCEKGYTLKGYNMTFCRGDDKWSQSLPGCHLYCARKDLKSGISNIVDFTKNNEDIGFLNSFEPGTIARIRCAPFYEKPDFDPFNEFISCLNNGKWDKSRKACRMRCGELESPVTQLSKGGINTNITEAPWHIGIYQRAESGKFENICAGTLISPRYVVTAAHCFFENQRNPNIEYNWSKYSIAAGKHYREYDKEGWDKNGVEKRNIENVWVPEEYNGIENGYYRDISVITLDRFIPFSHQIRPVCLAFKEEADQYIRSEIPGQVTAWSQVSERGKDSTLESLYMQTLSNADCKEELQKKNLANIRGDKFCLASALTVFACKGDSGSGFVVKSGNKYYLYGVVSHSPQRTQECNPSNLLVMTNALNYENYLKGYLILDNKYDIENL